MPPEQALGQEAITQSDLYSLSAMLYELVTGRPPF
jgi:serine/threonine protein kinase